MGFPSLPRTMKESRYSRWLLSQEAVLSGLKEEEVAFELDLEVEVKMIRYGWYFHGVSLLAKGKHKELNTIPRRHLEGNGQQQRQPGCGPCFSLQGAADAWRGAQRQTCCPEPLVVSSARETNLELTAPKAVRT